MSAAPEHATGEPGCIFCKIVAGLVPCRRVHEDAWTLAFLDVNPLTAGHTLVIPRRHVVLLEGLEVVLDFDARHHAAPPLFSAGASQTASSERSAPTSHGESARPVSRAQASSSA